jgi:hypothetical protein
MDVQWELCVFPFLIPSLFVIVKNYKIQIEYQLSSILYEQQSFLFLVVSFKKV